MGDLLPSLPVRRSCQLRWQIPVNCTCRFNCCFLNYRSHAPAWECIQGRSCVPSTCMGKHRVRIQHSLRCWTKDASGEFRSHAGAWERWLLKYQPWQLAAGANGDPPLRRCHQETCNEVPAPPDSRALFFLPRRKFLYDRNAFPIPFAPLFSQQITVTG